MQVHCIVALKIKVQFTLEQATKAQSGRRCVALLFFNLAPDGMGGQRHAPAALPPGKDPVPIVYEAGWAPGSVWMDAEKLAPPPPPGFDPRIVPLPTELSRPTCIFALLKNIAVAA